MKWLVTWMIIEILSVGCPNLTDEYGRDLTPGMANLASCIEVVEYKQQEEFPTYEEAKAFMEEGKRQKNLIPGQGLCCFEIQKIK